MQHLYRLPEGSVTFRIPTTCMSSLGKVLRVERIKPHAPLLVRGPVNSFEF